MRYHFTPTTMAIIFSKRFYLFLVRERGRERETEGEKHQCVVASHAPPTGDPVCNPGCALMGNGIADPLLRNLVLNPLSHASQGGWL